MTDLRKNIHLVCSSPSAIPLTLSSPLPLRKLQQQCNQQTILAMSPKMIATATATAATTNNNNSGNNTPTKTTFTKDQASMIASLIAGFGSGTLSSIACAPLDLIRTRMQVAGELQKRKLTTTTAATSTGGGGGSVTISKGISATPSPSLIQSLKDIIRVEGFSGCFRGLAPTLLTVPTFWSLYFPLYEVLKKDLHQRGVGSSSNTNITTNMTDDESSSSSDYQRVPPLVHMSAAIMAGAWADFFCNPMFIVRTRMQTEALHYMEMPLSERKPHGIFQTVRQLYTEGGISIFWRGFTASLLGLSHVAIQFPAYEFLKADARERSTNNQESAFDLLLASGLSKMLATSLTYPHEVVRSRMMDSRGVSETQKSLRQTLVNIVQKEGIGALYTGIHVSLVRVVPNCCITFMTYELFLRWAKSQI